MKNTKFKFVANTPVVTSILVISIIATISMRVTGGDTGLLFFKTYHSSLLSPLTWLRFFTHIFGHLNAEHLLNNMGYLLILGPQLEKEYGSKALVMVVMVSAFSQGILQYFFFPSKAALGFSGVDYTLVVLYALLNLRERKISINFPFILIIFFVPEFLKWIKGSDNVGHGYHLVGGVVGGLMWYIITRQTRFSWFRISKDEIDDGKIEERNEKILIAVGMFCIVGLAACFVFRYYS